MKAAAYIKSDHNSNVSKQKCYYQEDYYSYYIRNTLESLEHKKKCFKIAFAYLHALKPGSSKSHGKKGELPSSLNTLKQSKWFVDLKRLKHTQAGLLDGF